MKKNLIKLSILAEQALAEKEMAAIAGGDRKACECACYYDNQEEGASTASNYSANEAKGLVSTKGCVLCTKDEEGNIGYIYRNEANY